MGSFALRLIHLARWEVHPVRSCGPSGSQDLALWAGMWSALATT